MELKGRSSENVHHSGPSLSVLQRNRILPYLVEIVEVTS